MAAHFWRLILLEFIDHAFAMYSTFAQVLGGIETEIRSLHDLLQITSSTVGASTAASKQLQQLHQVEIHRLQSEIETHRSKSAQLAAEIVGITQKYEDQVLKLQDDLDRISQAEAAAKQALSHDRCAVSVVCICSTFFLFCFFILFCSIL